MTRNQYRLTWCREGPKQTIDGVEVENTALCSKTFRTQSRAERHIRILTSDEPWLEWAPDKGPNDFACCPGSSHDCSCGGQTNAQARDERRKDLPPIKWVRIDVRQITSTPFVEVVTLKLEEVE